MYLDKAHPYIVAELNSSHRGKVDVAKKMIDAAKACGCDAVKFQSWTDASLYSGSYYAKNPIARRMVKGFALLPEALVELSVYCRESGIDFASTPYSRSEVDLLVDACDVPYIKIASMDINNIPFLEYIAGRMVPIVLSTGMATLDEIRAAVRAIEGRGNHQICILHCVSLYPVAHEHVHLNNMRMLKAEFPECSVGYSDHTMGSEAACAATALGAVMIEKHFTLDSSMIGWDNQMATEPEQMEKLVRECRNVAAALGSYERSVTEEELAQRVKMRRSIVAAKHIPAGHVLSMEDLDAKRPGDGIPPDEFARVVGKKVKRDMEADEMLFPDDLE